MGRPAKGAKLPKPQTAQARRAVREGKQRERRERTAIVYSRPALPAEWDSLHLALLRKKRVTRTFLARYLENLMASHAPIMVSTALEELYRNMRDGDRESIRMTLESYQILAKQGGPVVNINQRIGPDTPRSFESIILGSAVAKQQPVLGASGQNTFTPDDPA